MIVYRLIDKLTGKASGATAYSRYRPVPGIGKVYSSKTGIESALRKAPGGERDWTIKKYRLVEATYLEDQMNKLNQDLSFTKDQYEEAKELSDGSAMNYWEKERTKIAALIGGLKKLFNLEGQD